MKSCLLVLMLFLFVSVDSTYAQKRGQARIDSLLQVSVKMKDDTAKVLVLQNISFEYSKIKPAEGIIYAQKELALASKLNWKKGIANSYNSIGINYLAASEYPAALDNYFKALTISEDIGDKNGTLKVLGNLSIVYRYEKKFDQALTYQLKVLGMTGKKDLEGQEYILGSIGLTYASLGQYPNAFDYQERALKIAEKLGDKEMIAKRLTNIGFTYSLVKNFPRELAFAHRALKQANAIDEKRLASVNLLNIADAYLSIAKDIDHFQPDSLVPAGRAANVAKSIVYSKQAIEVCKQTGNKIDLQTNYQNISEAHALAGNYREALMAYQQYTAIKDSLFSETNNIKIANLSSQRELDVKDKQLQIDKLEALKNRNERGFLLAGIGLMLGIIIAALRSYFVEKRTNEELQIAKKKIEERTEELDRINHQLEDIIDERTKDLKVKNKKLVDYSLYLSHQIRGPIATLKGILSLEADQLIEAPECVKLMNQKVSEIDANIIDANNMMESPVKPTEG